VPGYRARDILPIVFALVFCVIRMSGQESAEDLLAKANQGDPKAQYKLGVLYFEGKSVQPDYPAAARWFEMAALQGHAASQFALGELYEEGAGVPQDFVKAYAWMTRAISNAPGQTDYSSKRDHLVAEMTPGQVDEAMHSLRDIEQSSHEPKERSVVLRQNSPVPGSSSQSPTATLREPPQLPFREAPQQPSHLVSLGLDSLLLVEVIALATSVLILLILNPPRKVVALAFCILGTPIWWWLYETRTGGLNEFSGQGTLGSAVFHSAITFIWPCSALWVTFFGISYWRHVNSTRWNTSYKEGVPHCHFAKMEDGGFVVTMFNSEGGSLAGVSLSLAAITLLIWYFIVGITVGFLVILVIGAAAAYFSARRAPVRIEVARHGVFIGEFHIELDEFHRFTIIADRRSSWLGCDYGMLQRAICTGWPEWKLKEIAGALNDNLDRARMLFAITFDSESPAAPPPLSHSPIPPPPPRPKKKY
jgi:Sel1 repeat